MRKFQDLLVWEKAHEVALTCFELSKSLPSEEKFGLISQLRRAAFSIPTNIAEGCGRHTDSDFARYLSIAAGSTSEVGYLLILIKDINYLSAEAIDTNLEKVNEVKKMLNAFIIKLKANS